MPSGSHDINVKMLSLMGIVSTILVVALVVATQAWFRYEFQQENERKYINIPYRELVELEEAQLAELDEPEKVVEFDGQQRVVIPIDEAMQMVIAEHEQKQE
jgi:hypothetical protein